MTTFDEQLLLDEGETSIPAQFKFLHASPAPFKNRYTAMDFGSLIKPNPFQTDFKFPIPVYPTQGSNITGHPPLRNLQPQIETKAIGSNIPDNQTSSSTSEIPSLVSFEKISENKPKKLSYNDRELVKSLNKIDYTTQKRTERSTDNKRPEAGSAQPVKTQKEVKKPIESISADTFPMKRPTGILRLGERSRFSRDFEEGSGSRNTLDSGRKEGGRGFSTNPVKPSHFKRKE